MAQRKSDGASKRTLKSRGNKKLTNWKPGSQAEEARNVAPPGDFGVPAGTERTADRDYVSRNTKRSDRGNMHPASHERDGDRSSGAGAPASGPGSSSGGDIDTDITGVGFGGSGVAQGGPDSEAEIGAAASDGSSGEFASPVPPGRPGEVEVIPAQRRNQSGIGKVGGARRVRGSGQMRDADASTGADAQGADAATNPRARDDDSFMGEVSTGEAAGDDLGISPSSDTQGARPGDNQIRGTQKDPRAGNGADDSADDSADDGAGVGDED